MKSIYNAKFLAEMPKKVNVIYVNITNEEGETIEDFDPVFFRLTYGGSNSKRWESDAYYTNCGVIKLTNGSVGRLIRSFEKQAEECSGFVEVRFGEMDKEGGILHADWDWSEVKKGSSQWLNFRVDDE